MFVIDKRSRTPIYEQLIDQFEACILSGDISADGKLPSVRRLSLQLSINPNTLQRAFAEIERRGLCYTVPGSGRFLSHDALDRLCALTSTETEAFRNGVEALKRRGIAKEALLHMIEQVYGMNETSEKEGFIHD